MLAFIINTRGHFVNLLHKNYGTESPKTSLNILLYIDKKSL
jgi:hypothetical protein